MLIIIHRINKIDELKKIPLNYGVEVDIRGYGDRLFLSHEPISEVEEYDSLEEYLKFFNHSFIIFNLKEAGYEEKVISLAEKYGIENFFLLDCEFPYFYRATRKEGFRRLAIRYSEAEPIEFVESQIINGKPLIDWVWIDTNTKLPITHKEIPILKKFRTCLVCPERWGRPEDIREYIEKLKVLDFKLDAVMTGKDYVKLWEESGVIND